MASETGSLNVTFDPLTAEKIRRLARADDNRTFANMAHLLITDGVVVREEELRAKGKL